MLHSRSTRAMTFIKINGNQNTNHGRLILLLVNEQKFYMKIKHETDR